MKSKYNRRNEAMNPKSQLLPVDDSIPTFLSNCVVRIIISNKSMGTGFFIKFESNNKYYYYLMTCHHVIKDEYIKSKETIIIINKNFNEIKMNLDGRFIKNFEDLNIDIIIIEIKEEDGINKNFFLNPDMSYKSGYNQFINKNVYILQYPSYRPFSYSKNIIKSIDLEENEFTHLASTEHGSSGSPIFLENHETVLGIHTSGYEGNNEIENYGIFIGPLVEFFKKNIKPNKSHKVLELVFSNIYERGYFFQRFITDYFFFDLLILEIIN